MAVESRSSYEAASAVPETTSAPARATRKRVGSSRLASVAGSLTGFILPVCILIVWHLASISGLIKPYLLPPPATVAATLWELTLNGRLARDLQASVIRWAIGFVCGGGLGLLLGSW